MNEITGPIIGITLVLCAVFLPSAFLGGVTGQFYRQFALTIAVSMLISAVNAMTMTPARAAAIFGHRTHGAHGGGGHEALPWWIFVLGALVSAAWLEPVFGELFGLAAGGEAATGLDPARAKALGWAAWLAALIPGALAGGVLGWFIIGPVNWGLGKFFRGFNWVFDRVTEGYGRIVGGVLRLSAIVLVRYGGLLAQTD